MEAPKFSDFNEGSRIIKDTIRRKKVFIVLDDVDEISQVHMLIGHHNWLSSQSRIIITTREKCVLDQIETTCEREGLFDVYRSYKAEFMDDSNSLKLFSKHAFKTDFPLERYEHYSKEIVSIAAGLPLVLVVLDSMLFYVKGQDLWEAKLEQLRAIQPRQILEKLRIRFDTLGYEQKQIYLDIAVYFRGSDATRPSYMWYDCGFHPRVESVLISMSLLTIDHDNRLIMHDQLIDLGLQIVREEREFGKQSRFWNLKDSRHAFLTNQGTKYATALELVNDYEDSEPIRASHFCDVPNIRYLSMHDQHLDGDFKCALTNLRWLRWNLSSKFMPTNLHLENLIILDLSHSQLIEDEDIWSQIKVGKKLKVLDLSYSSNLSVPPYISTLVSLEILKISECKSTFSLDGIKQLKSLKYIDVSSCDNLESFPNLSNLEKLVRLDLKFCRKLVEIQGLEKLGVLQILNAHGCINLVKIEGLHKLNFLEHLVLHRCYSFEANLDVSELKQLKKIDVGSCWKLTEIKGLHTVKSLEDLNLENCKSLEGDLDLSELKKLKRIIVHGCEKLTGVKGLHMLISLEHLDLSDCSFKGVLDLSNLKSLQQLFAGELEVTNIRNSIKLKELSFFYSVNVLDLEYLDECDNCFMVTNTQTLWIDGFNVCVGSMKQFMDLSCVTIKNLRISGFLYIEELPCLSNLKKLEVFYLGECEKLVKVHGLKRLESLETLNIHYCNSLKRLDLPTFGVLKDINASICTSLYEIEGIGGIAFLKRLSIISCPKLKEIGDLRMLESLNRLSLVRNKELTGTRGLDNLKSLEILRISDCESIETLPDLSRLKKLTKFDATGCVKLSKLSGLDELQSLVRLDVRGCERLGVLPHLPNAVVLQGPWI